MVYKSGGNDFARWFQRTCPPDPITSIGIQRQSRIGRLVRAGEAVFSHEDSAAFLREVLERGARRPHDQGLERGLGLRVDLSRDRLRLAWLRTEPAERLLDPIEPVPDGLPEERRGIVIRSAVRGIDGLRA